jgi:hypothetical protein
MVRGLVGSTASCPFQTVSQSFVPKPVPKSGRARRYAIAGRTAITTSRKATSRRPRMLSTARRGFDNWSSSGCRSHKRTRSPVQPDQHVSAANGRTARPARCPAPSDEVSPFNEACSSGRRAKRQLHVGRFVHARVYLHASSNLECAASRNERSWMIRP